MIESLIEACEFCDCTDDLPCPEGCGWDPRFLAAGRLICSSCADYGRAALALGMPPQPYVLTLETDAVLEACLA